MKTFKELREKTLTPAEKKKREEIAKAIEKDQPDMPMAKKMAIATATAKRVAEGAENYTVKKGAYTRKVDGKTADKMKRQGWKIVAREGVELEEGKMKEFHDYIDQGKSAQWIAKKMGLDMKTVKELMTDMKESVELDESPKVGDKTKYQGSPAVITRVDKKRQAVKAEVLSGKHKGQIVSFGFDELEEAVKTVKELMTDMKESVQEVTEAKSSSDYPLYHKTYSGAMQAAYAHAKKKGYEVDKDDIDRKVASGPRKPSSGKTNSFTLKLVGEKKKMLAVQVTNLDNKRYELNCYIT